MIKKGMNALLLLCILLVCNGKSGAMEKEGNNAPEKKVSVESDLSLIHISEHTRH